MKHKELIELLYKHRETIDKAFSGEEIESLPSELVDDAAVFVKVAKRFELSDTYIQFANSMLKKVDANYTFGDYEEEIKLLIRLKGDYLESNDKELIYRIKSLVRTLYKKTQERDSFINARINDIVNNNDSSIELVIKDAIYIDKRVSELIDSHAKNLHILGGELRGLDDELDLILVDIGLDMLEFTDNIHIYNKRLSDFILRTEKRKTQNKKLSSLSNKIIKEQDHELKSLLLSNTEVYNHTLKEKKTGNIKHLPSPLELRRDSFVDAISKLLKIQKTKKGADANKPYEASVSVELKSINIELIQNEILRDKPQDIYSYILKHKEIEKFKEDGLDVSYAFKTYLTIVQNYRDEIVLDAAYNNSNIRVAKWI